MEARGLLRDWDEVVIRGDAAAREFVAFWLRAGRVVAAMNANVWDAGEQLAALVDSGASVDAARLADPTLPLEPAA
jgi:3-phenylpropionate/trans-cinnamate dioxygenase ferredoxin reductase subunit